MADPSAPMRRSPLAGREHDLARISAAEVPFLVHVDVRCDPETAAGLDLPFEPNTVAGDMTWGILWLGPDEWLVVTTPVEAPRRLEELRSAVADRPHSVVDVSDSRTVIELRGVDRLELLATGCGLDLDPRGGWVPGRCAQTTFARIPVILQELDGATRVFVRWSFAGSLVDRLLAAVDVLRS
jgi:sarcosine oxidase subunit gamma